MTCRNVNGPPETPVFSIVNKVLSGPNEFSFRLLQTYLNTYK